MSLTQVGKYNNVRAEIMPVLPPKGTIVEYRFTQKFYDPATKQERYRHNVDLPPLSRFKDIYTDKEGNRKEEWVDIGLVDAVDLNGNPLPNQIKRISFFPDASHGTWSIVIGQSRLSDMLFQYCELGSFVGSNKNRDESVEVIMVRVDHDGEAKAKRDKRNKRREAINYASAMSEEDVARTAIIFGWNPEASQDVLREQIESAAEKNPEHFLSKAKDERAELIALLYHGLLTEVLAIDGKGMKLIWKENGGKIMDLTSTDKEMVGNEFYQYINQAPAGGAIAKNVKQEIDKKVQKTKNKPPAKAIV